MAVVDPKLPFGEGSKRPIAVLHHWIKIGRKRTGRKKANSEEVRLSCNKTHSP